MPKEIKYRKDGSVEYVKDYSKKDLEKIDRVNFWYVVIGLTVLLILGLWLISLTN